MTLVLIPLSVSALVVGDWEVEISGNEATIIGYTGSCPDKMILPTQVGNYPVVGISDKYEHDTPIFSDNVTEIVFPEGYRYIKGYYIFKNLRDTLRNVMLPQSLEVFEASFFEFSKITDITIPSKVKEIGMRQFAWCDNLENVYLNDGLQIIGQDAFGGCDSLKEIKIPNSVICICYNAFNGCKSLKEIIIPDSVIYYGYYSFDSAEYYYAKKSVIDKHNLCGPVISNCENLETAIIGNGVIFTNSGELSNCPKLSSFHLSNSISHIFDYGILENNSNIKVAVFPEGIQKFGSSTLKDCLNLETVVLPRSIKNLGDFETFTSNGSPLPKLYLYGYKGTEAEKFAYNKGFPFVDISVATPTNSKVKIDGKDVAFTAYNIGGNNYFKLRDVASAISGTSKNFNVGWDGNNNAISLTSKTAYSNVGGELKIDSNAVAVEPIITNPKIFVDGKLTTFMAFGINDNNYIKLRDLGEVFDFSVEWNDSTQTIEISTKKGYSK